MNFILRTVHILLFQNHRVEICFVRQGGYCGALGAFAKGIQKANNNN